jgi:hypothetical protein
LAESGARLRQALAKTNSNPNNACTSDVASSFASVTSMLGLITGPATNDACYQICREVARVGSMACAGDNAATDSDKAARWRQAVVQSFSIPLDRTGQCPCREPHLSLNGFLMPRAREAERIEQSAKAK